MNKPMRLAFALLAVLLACTGPCRAFETIRADDARISRVGRTVLDADGTLRFGYPGVTLEVTFTGTQLAVEAAGGAGSLLDVIVDGGAPTTLRPGPGVHSIALLKDAKPGPHRVSLVHRTETWLGVVSIARFITDGRFGPALPLPARKLLVLGDSVSCGANMERVGGDKSNPYWWNARVSYGMLLGRALQARVALVCYGGRGLVRSWNGRTDEARLPDFYEMAIADAAHPVKWHQEDDDPDLILVAIGTNDFTSGMPEHDAYVAAYAAFVRTLLRDHPHAQVVLTGGAILNGEKKERLSAYLLETVQRAGSARVHAIPSEYHPGDAADAHPTTPQHAQMADELAPQLRRLMGW
jgi:lysophospholipase L1-like esterase